MLIVASNKVQGSVHWGGDHSWDKDAMLTFENNWIRIIYLFIEQNGKNHFLKRKNDKNIEKLYCRVLAWIMSQFIFMMSSM